MGASMGYEPDPASVAVLGTIVDKLASAQAVPGSFKRQPSVVVRLSGGELYLDTTLELDTDGWPGQGQGDPTWQPQTSLRYNDVRSIDANRVPYFVLPLPVSWPKQFGVRLGDYAAVIYKARLAFAVFADFGNNPGEGSIELLRQLGKERLKPDGSIINAGMGPGVITIVFPGSGPGTRLPDEATLLGALSTRAAERFQSLGGVIGAKPVPQPLSQKIELAESLAHRMVEKAQAEFATYGGVPEGESPLRERIGDYWRAVGENHDGADHDSYWSAVFISFVVRNVGGENAFLCCDQHSKYVHRAILDRQSQRQDRFWAYRPGELTISPGDILAMNRGNARQIDFEEAVASDDFSSHADIAVSVSGGRPSSIGGNVGKSPGTVGTKTFRWSEGRLVNADNAKQQVYAVLRPPAL